MSKITKLAILGLIAVVVILAALKNPSNIEAKELVKQYVAEKVNQKVMSEMVRDDSKDSPNQLGSMLGSMFISKIVENIADVDVTNFVAFSTFKVTAFGNTDKRLVSGIILFGNVIPLSSDIKKESSNQSQD